jgi:hypothetical protein
MTHRASSDRDRAKGNDKAVVDKGTIGRPSIGEGGNGEEMWKSHVFVTQIFCAKAKAPRG